MSRWHSSARAALCLLPGCWLDSAEVERARDRVPAAEPDADADADADTDSDSDTDTDADADADADSDSDTDTDADVDTDPLLSCADELWVGLTTSGDSSGGVDGFQSTLCQSSLGPEAVLQWTAPSAGCWAFSTEGSSFDTVAYVLDQCAGPELACNDDFLGIAGPSQAVTEVAAGATVLVVVDGFNVGDSGPWTVTAAPVLPMPFDADAGVGGGFGGDTTGADSSIEVPIGCVFASGADHLIAWTAPAAGSYTFSLVADFDSVLSVHDPCSGSLRVCQNLPLIGLESVTVQLSSGEMVILRVGGSFDDTGVYAVGVSTP